MKSLIALILLSTTAFAHEITTVNRRSCPQVPVPAPAPTLESLQPKLNANKIEILAGNTVTGGNVARFLGEYEKFPASLRTEMINRGAKIRLMEGTGVGIDPTLEAAVTTEGTRTWDQVPGAGGEIEGSRNVPTRIAVNHLYDKHGASNLVLHEHAHTLDSIYGRQSLSKSDVWKNLMATTPKSAEFTRSICGQYCLDREEERFAELFSYYFACEDSRKHLEEELPAVAEFFSKMNSVSSIIAGNDPRGAAALAAAAPAAANPTAEICETTAMKDATIAIPPLTAVLPHVQKILEKPATAGYSGGSTSASGMK